MTTSQKALLHEIERLRRLNPIPLDRAGVIEHLRSELDEIARESPGSKAAQEEVADAYAVCVHLCFIEGVSIATAEKTQIRKLRARLDLVEQGYSWKEAKTLLRGSTESVVFVIPASELRKGEHFSWVGSFGEYKVLANPLPDKEFISRVVIHCLRNGREITTRLEAQTPCTVTWSLRPKPQNECT